MVVGDGEEGNNESEQVVRSLIHCDKDSEDSCVAAAAAAAEEAATTPFLLPEVTARAAKAAASVFDFAGADGRGIIASKSSTSYPLPFRVGKTPVLELNSFPSALLPSLRPPLLCLELFPYDGYQIRLH